MSLSYLVLCELAVMAGTVYLFVFVRVAQDLTRGSPMGLLGFAGGGIGALLAVLLLLGVVRARRSPIFRDRQPPP